DTRHRLLRREQEVGQIADHVLPSSVDRNVLPSFADELHDRLRLVDVAAQLVEVRDLEIRAELDAPFVRRELADQYAQQRRLADAVVADDPDAVTAHDPEREVVQQLLAPKRMRDVPCLDDFASQELVRLVEQDARGALPLDALRAFLTHRLERPDTAFVTMLACLDPLPDPRFLLGELLVEEGVPAILLGIGERFLREIVAIAA